MRCCSAQITGVWESPEQTLENAEQVFCEAARAGAALISFPEQFATGWDPASNKNSEDFTGPTVTGLRRLAEKYSIAAIGSFREAFSPQPRNTSIAIGNDGEILATYTKIHLFTPGGENRAFTPGAGLATFTLGGVRFGLAICYDLRFPEIFRLYRREGVHAVIVPAAWPESRIRYLGTLHPVPGGGEPDVCRRGEYDRHKSRRPVRRCIHDRRSPRDHHRPGMRGKRTLVL